jgi:uncharacterized membrane protein YfcA
MASGRAPRRWPWPVQGVVVGLLTGIAGVGGGFAIVPALVLLAGLPMQLASGTSLVLISTNSLVALGALGHWPASAAWVCCCPWCWGGAAVPCWASGWRPTSRDHGCARASPAC